MGGLCLVADEQRRAEPNDYAEFQTAASAALRDPTSPNATEHFTLLRTQNDQCIVGLKKATPTPPSDAWRPALVTCKSAIEP
jgi:hypothetical protein